MDNEKKPKRPRIGTPVQNGHEAGNTFDKSPYGQDSDSAAAQPIQQPYQRAYQPHVYQPYSRQGQYQPRHNYYQQQQQQYQNHNNTDNATAPRNSDDNGYTSPQQYNQGGYQPRQQYNRQSGYQPRQQYNHQGEYQPRQQYNNHQGGYNNHQNADGNWNNNAYQPRLQYNRQGDYNQGYNRQGRYNNRQGGYNHGYNRQGGYNNRQGGYNHGYNRQDGYNNRQGGYNNNRQREYNQGYNRPNRNMRFTPRPRQIEYTIEELDPNTEIRLNKYMSNAGICSRREADEKILAGEVKINGEVVTELGTKLKVGDVVEYNGQVVVPERKCYVLLNKPKDCVTTSDDPGGRTTVLDIVKNACRERIYPVGRLDRNTTGVLLLTNDGDLASKLTHPKYVKKKIYHVWTDKAISEEDMQRIADGIELEDGEIHADEISYVNEQDKKQAGIEIHSGRNRIVRRIFEALGYRVVKLDRVYFAGLTKKNLPRGKWRYLTQEEVNYLRQGSFE